MMPLPPLSVELRSLLELAGIKVVLPAAPPEGTPRAGAQTSMRAGVRVLSAFRVEYGAHRDDEGPRLEVVTLPHDRILRGVAEEDQESALEAYLEREARRELAMRSLELGDGAAEHLDTPLGELILAREAELPAALPITILVDGEETPARTVAVGRHAATWSSLPGPEVAAVVYERRWLRPREFVTLAPSA